MQSYNVLGQTIEFDSPVTNRVTSAVLKKNTLPSIHAKYGGWNFSDTTNILVPDPLNEEYIKNVYDPSGIKGYLVFYHNTDRGSDKFVNDGLKLQETTHYSINKVTGRFDFTPIADKLVYNETVIEIVPIFSSLRRSHNYTFTYMTSEDVIDLKTVSSSSYVSTTDFYNRIVAFRFGRVLRPRLDYKVTFKSDGFAYMKFVVDPTGGISNVSPTTGTVDLFVLERDHQQYRIVNSNETQSRTKQQILSLPDVAFPS